MAKVLKSKLGGSIEYEYVDEEEELGYTYGIIEPELELGPAEQVIEAFEAAKRPTRVRVPQREEVEFLPSQIRRFNERQRLRQAQVKEYIQRPIAYVWEFSKKDPNRLERIPIRRPLPTAGILDILFPPTPRPEPVPTFVPSPFVSRVAAPVREVYVGSATLPSGEVRHFYETQLEETTELQEY